MQVVLVLLGITVLIFGWMFLHWALCPEDREDDDHLFDDDDL